MSRNTKRCLQKNSKYKPSSREEDEREDELPEHCWIGWQGLAEKDRLLRRLRQNVLGHAVYRSEQEHPGRYSST